MCNICNKDPACSYFVGFTKTCCNNRWIVGRKFKSGRLKKNEVRKKVKKWIKRKPSCKFETPVKEYDDDLTESETTIDTNHVIKKEDINVQDEHVINNEVIEHVINVRSGQEIILKLKLVS